MLFAERAHLTWPTWFVLFSYRFRVIIFLFLQTIKRSFGRAGALSGASLGSLEQTEVTVVADRCLSSHTLFALLKVPTGRSHMRLA